jgi:predicted Fe-S protein YdhL (DUF1289 family)
MLSKITTELIASSAILVRANALNEAWPVPSPCVSVCQMDESGGLCLGCFRTLDEIRLWGNADATFKRSVWASIEARLAACLP